MNAEMHKFSQWIDETDAEKLLSYFNEKLVLSGFGIVSVQEEHFKPYGYTALFLLSESHFAIHTFPEHKTTYIELTSCVKKPFNAFIKSIS